MLPARAPRVASSTAMSATRGSAAWPSCTARRASTLLRSRRCSQAGSSMYRPSPTTAAASAITAAARRRLRTSRSRERSRASASLRSAVRRRRSSAWRRRQSSTAGASTSWYSSRRTAPSGSDAATGRRIRWRSSRSSADSSGSGGTSVNSRSSFVLSAIFRPPDVTRKRSASDAASRSASGMPVSASSTCARTIVPAPPSRRSVSTRSSREPAVDSSSQIRCMTSCR